MSKTAADIMEKNVITAQKDTSIFDLVDMFVENNITAIPIIKDDKEIIGIVTDADLLYKEVKPCVPQYVTLLGANIYYGTLKEYQQEMAGVYTTSVNEGTIDEAPMAYKSLDDILDVIGDTVDVIDVMKPVYNFKAAEEKHF